MSAFEDEPQSSYELAPKQGRSVSFYLFLGLGVPALLGMGSCVWMFVGLFQKAADRQIATNEFIERVFADGFPAVGDPIFDEDLNVTTESIKDLQAWLTEYGAPTNFGQTTCSVNTSASTVNSEGGTIAVCNTPMEYQNTSGRVEMAWKQRGDTWKVFHFLSLYDNLDGKFAPATELEGTEDD